MEPIASARIRLCDLERSPPHPSAREALRAVAAWLIQVEDEDLHRAWHDADLVVRPRAVAAHQHEHTLGSPVAPHLLGAAFQSCDGNLRMVARSSLRLSLGKCRRLVP